MGLQRVGTKAQLLASSPCRTAQKCDLACFRTFLPHGRTLSPHGSPVLPHGGMIPPHRRMILPCGPMILPDRWRISPCSGMVLPSGRMTRRGQRFILPHGRMIPKHGGMVLPCGRMVPPCTGKMARQPLERAPHAGGMDLRRCRMSGAQSADLSARIPDAGAHTRNGAATDEP